MEGRETLLGMVRREWKWVLGQTASSVIIRAPCETFADMEDVGTILWGVFCHVCWHRPSAPSLFPDLPPL